ncbi:MAG: hypothetical protein K2H89_10845 [Oscillospiraceae bacterium]|nr:hypothetical protein [Oscillospiraceae bacterium]
MKKNKTSLTISQALKIYNGSSLLKLTLQFSCIMAVLYIASITFFTLLIGTENGFAAAHEEVSETLMSSMFLAMDGGIAVAVISILTYEKKLPGGKFFRTVKGGFDTYKKMRAALVLSTIIGICLYTGIICVLNAVIPIMIYGTATCISVAVFLLLGVGIVNLVNVIKNDIARTVLNFILLLALSLVGVITVYASEGKLGIVHIIAAILAIVLIPISHKLMLASYRKHGWNN